MDRKTRLKNIPFNRPFLGQAEAAAVKKVLGSGKLSGDGVIGREVERKITKLFRAKHALLTTSGTHALEMAMMLLDLRAGDEVILPSFTFVSTANAIIRAGAKPVFCEITEETLTVDPEDLGRRITSRTRAVIPVHYAGVSAEMDRILGTAKACRLAVVEDAAQGVNAKYKGRYLGTIGDSGAYSFHDTKNYVSGEGGAFLTGSEELARRAEIIREKGTNRANFLRGEVDKYTWVDLGSSYILSELLAAILSVQLEMRHEIQKRRSHIHRLYMDLLGPLAKSERLRLPVVPKSCESNYHIFYVLLRNERERNSAIARLKESGIGATFHYIPLHSSPYARRTLGTRDLELPVTDRIAGTLLRLPIYPDLTDNDVARVAESLRKILTSREP